MFSKNSTCTLFSVIAPVLLHFRSKWIMQTDAGSRVSGRHARRSEEHSFVCITNTIHRLHTYSISHKLASLFILKIIVFIFPAARARSLIRLDDDPMIHLAALSQTALGSEGPIKRKDTRCSRLLGPDAWELWLYCEMNNYEEKARAHKYTKRKEITVTCMYICNMNGSMDQ